MKNISSYTIYCDDVRREADGRPSLMGVYPNSATIDLEGTQKLPKICAYTETILPAIEDLSSISVVSFWNDKDLQRVDIPRDVVNSMNLKHQTNKGTGSKHILSTVMEIRDLDIDDGGILTTKLIINGAEIESRKIHLRPQITVPADIKEKAKD